MTRDVLREACERLFKHHKDSSEVCRGLEEVEKSSGLQHRPVHAYNRDFYQKMSKTGERERILHFPKIIKDALLLKRKKKVLERRRHALRVYKTLKEAGAEFEFNPNDI